MKKFNPYRAWANDGKVLSQVKWAPSPTYTQCVKCHAWVKDGTQQMVDFTCEACQHKQVIDAKLV